MEKKLQVLLDKMEIMEVMARYGRAADTKDWEMLRTVFAETFDFIAVDGVGNPMPMLNININDFVKWNSDPGPKHKASEHMFSNFLIDVDGDKAHAVMSLRAQHYNPDVCGDHLYEVGGPYNGDFVRTADGWRLVRLEANFTWTKGNQSVCM